MKIAILLAAILGVFQSMADTNSKDQDFDKYPGVVLSNKEIKMKVFLPDPENDIYRTTRYDWSGAIGSVQCKYMWNRARSKPGPRIILYLRNNING